jgi:hypothetical protein
MAANSGKGTKAIANGNKKAKGKKASHAIYRLPAEIFVLDGNASWDNKKPFIILRHPNLATK